eukprot:2002175-Pleurochrysis_carterae.AAC.1
MRDWAVRMRGTVPRQETMLQTLARGHTHTHTLLRRPTSRPPPPAANGPMQTPHGAQDARPKERT